MPKSSAASAPELRAVYEAAREFIATTSVFRQRRESRDEFEALAIAVLNAARRRRVIKILDSRFIVPEDVDPLRILLVTKAPNDDGTTNFHYEYHVLAEEGEPETLFDPETLSIAWRVEP